MHASKLIILFNQTLHTQSELLILSLRLIVLEISKNSFKDFSLRERLEY